MGETTGIQWCHHTFNPWIGCEKVSPACDHCYADLGSRRLAAQHHLTLWGADASRYMTGEDYWKAPHRWNRAAERAGVRARVFCASFADVFEDRADLVEPRRRLLHLIGATPHLDWLLLTKRTQNMVRLAGIVWLGKWPDNVWAGATVEDQERADERIPWLQEVPARVRFLSIEPMMSPVDLENVHPYYLKRGEPHPHEPRIRFDCLRGHMKGPDDMLPDQRVHWVIVGGESGPRARPFEMPWAQTMIDMCRGAETPVFVKQLGSVWARAQGAKDGHGGDPAEWPEALRVREIPGAA